MTLQLPGRFETKQALESALQDIVDLRSARGLLRDLCRQGERDGSGKITAAAKQIVHPDQMVWIVVGDQAKIQKGIDELGFGEIHKMSPDGEILN